MNFPTRISTNELETIRKNQPQIRLIDVRTPSEWDSVHIPGSYNVPLATLSEHSSEFAANVDTPIVLVCQSGNRAQQAEQVLRQTELEHIYILDGGMQAWQSDQLPVKRGRERWALERQVRGLAGSIVFLALLGSLIWHPLLYLAMGIGAGLTWSALSNSCLMGTMLSKLPYNKSERICDLPYMLEMLKK